MGQYVVHCLNKFQKWPIFNEYIFNLVQHGGLAVSACASHRESSGFDSQTGQGLSVLSLMCTLSLINKYANLLYISDL